VMADTLVERITGRSAAAATPIAVNLVLSDETLFGASNAPATVSGYGPMPAAVARGLISGAVTDPRSRATLRRLYAHPASGALVAMESRARLFRGGWPPSSSYGISAAAHRTATHRSATATTPGHGWPGVQLMRITGSDYVNDATTSKRSPAGSSNRTSMKSAGTQLNSPPQRARDIGRQRLREPRRSRQAMSKFASV